MSVNLLNVVLQGHRCIARFRFAPVLMDWSIEEFESLLHEELAFSNRARLTSFRRAGDTVTAKIDNLRSVRLPRQFTEAFNAGTQADHSLSFRRAEKELIRLARNPRRSAVAASVAARQLQLFSDLDDYSRRLIVTLPPFTSKRLREFGQPASVHQFFDRCEKVRDLSWAKLVKMDELGLR